MPALDKPDSPLTDHRQMALPLGPSRRTQVRRRSPAAITLLVYLCSAGTFLGWLLVGLTIWVAAFFRDPVRTTPRGDKLIVAPADGLVTMIAKVPPPPELRGDGRACRRPSIRACRFS